MARESRKEPLMQGGGLCRGLQPLLIRNGATR